MLQFDARRAEDLFVAPSVETVELDSPQVDETEPASHPGDRRRQLRVRVPYGIHIDVELQVDGVWTSGVLHDVSRGGAAVWVDQTSGSPPVVGSTVVLRAPFGTVRWKAPVVVRHVTDMDGRTRWGLELPLVEGGALFDWVRAEMNRHL